MRFNMCIKKIYWNMMIFWKFYFVPLQYTKLYNCILFVYKEIKYLNQCNFIKIIKTKNKKVISEMIH